MSFVYESWKYLPFLSRLSGPDHPMRHTFAQGIPDIEKSP